MKKEMIVMLGFMFLLAGLAGVSAEPCDLEVSMINQDPYPATPGDYVKLVFQVEGVSNPDCGNIDFELVEQYPLKFDPGFDPTYSFQGGVYDKDYSSFFIATYKVRVDEDALEGDNPLEVRYRYGKNRLFISEDFNLNIEDTHADFEVYIKEYNRATKTITFEILNIADVGIEALTVAIPEQDNIEVKGPSTNIVGDLDSNDYTTADFEATPTEGEITLQLSYTDSINVRRTENIQVEFEPKYFEDRVEDQNQRGFGSYLIWIVLIGLVVWYFWRRHKKKKAAKNRRK